jgi:tRNA threonylcarbamoyladenosine biosynthesis protein TsaE
LHSPDDNRTLHLASEADTLALGKTIATILHPGLVIHLSGDLGAGKTTLARGILRGLGHTGAVKSPTFTLVEPYNFSKLYLYHFDFYRFLDPEELEESGFRDYFNPDSVCLVEWAENVPTLPPADLHIALQPAGSGRDVDIRAFTDAGARCLAQLNISMT